MHPSKAQSGLLSKALYRCNDVNRYWHNSEEVLTPLQWDHSRPVCAICGLWQMSGWAAGRFRLQTYTLWCPACWQRLGVLLYAVPEITILYPLKPSNTLKKWIVVNMLYMWLFVWKGGSEVCWRLCLQTREVHNAYLSRLCNPLHYETIHILCSLCKVWLTCDNHPLLKKSKLKMC